MAVRVALVDDHEVVRRGLRDLLDGEPGIEVVAEAGGVEEALARVGATTPDVVVVDVRLPDGDGVSLCRALRAAGPAAAVPGADRVRRRARAGRGDHGRARPGTC